VKILILGAGMMGRALAFDLFNFSKFDTITISDRDKKMLNEAKKFLKNKSIRYEILDASNKVRIEKFFGEYDIIISAIPYFFNYFLTKTAIKNKTHFLDLGGNNKVVEKQIKLSSLAEKNEVIVIPDCGLAPGLVSIITRDIVEYLDEVEYVKIRVGGLPLKPIPPFNYQIVFSLNGLINEYVEDAIVLDNKKIISKKSMTDIEEISFKPPFSKMEAFVTSGGVSTLPYTFRYIIKYIDYKTIRYPGHCKTFRPFFELDLGSEKPVKINNKDVIPRNLLVKLLEEKIPKKGKDVVLLKVISKGRKDKKEIELEYEMIDYIDEKNNITAMMRTTTYPVSIIAQMINNKEITKTGVNTCENIVPTDIFFKELEKRNIKIIKKIV